MVCQGGEENNGKTQENNPLFAPTRHQFPHIGPGNYSADGHEAHDPTDGGLAAPDRLKIDGIEVENGNVGKNQEHQDIEKKKRTDPWAAGVWMQGGDLHSQWFLQRQMRVRRQLQGASIQIYLNSIM